MTWPLLLSTSLLLLPNQWYSYLSLFINVVFPKFELWRMSVNKLITSFWDFYFNLFFLSLSRSLSLSHSLCFSVSLSLSISIYLSLIPTSSCWWIGEAIDVHRCEIIRHFELLWVLYQTHLTYLLTYLLIWAQQKFAQICLFYPEHAPLLGWDPVHAPGGRS